MRKRIPVQALYILPLAKQETNPIKMKTLLIFGIVAALATVNAANDNNVATEAAVQEQAQAEPAWHGRTRGPYPPFPPLPPLPPLPPYGYCLGWYC